MYEPPIRLFEMPMEISKSINKQNDEFVLQAIKKVGVDVDREELIKAMNFDRKQYDKGRADAFQEVLETMHEIYTCQFFCMHDLAEDCEHECDGCLYEALKSMVERKKNENRSS